MKDQIISTLFLAVVVVVVSANKSNSSRPNILFLFPDQWRWVRHIYIIFNS
jgi:hypothetical protein